MPQFGNKIDGIGINIVAEILFVRLSFISTDRHNAPHAALLITLQCFAQAGTAQPRDGDMGCGFQSTELSEYAGQLRPYHR